MSFSSPGLKFNKTIISDFFSLSIVFLLLLTNIVVQGLRVFGICSQHTHIGVELFVRRRASSLGEVLMSGNGSDPPNSYL